jgi:group II intron reverse transcriptase/maturase
MRTAETVLSIIQERGRRELPLEDIYRQLYNPNLYLRAYARLYANEGAMTPGATEETVDGMSLAKIEKIINDLRYERYRWTPVRRTYIEKKNSVKKRPLGIPSWSDKLLQEVIRSILEAYYEPQFSDQSHGYRPNRGCHTALKEIQRTWKGTRWFVEGDIRGCFDHIDHSILMDILAENLHDNRFLRLIGYMLQAGYLEQWSYHITASGTPQGGVISPILANIYLDKLDTFVERALIPAYTRGKTRKRNNRYITLMQQSRYQRKHGNIEVAKRLRKEAQQLPSMAPNDPDYRRLRYIRYADDVLLGFAGPKAEAEEIKQRLAEFLHQALKLGLSQEKTLITHATTQAARFLGYEIVTQQVNDKHSKDGGRRVNGRIGLRVAADVVDKYCTAYMKRGKPVHRPELTVESDYTIARLYQAEYRGIVQYYMLAQNISWFWKLHWVMQTSLLKTLANKHKTSVQRMIRKYVATRKTPEHTYKCLKVTVERGNDKSPLVAYFGGIPLRRQQKVTLKDLNPLKTRKPAYSELIVRLLTDECELCGSRHSIEVHHIRKLADLKVKGGREKPQWMKTMAARRRKTLVVCKDCHVNIHAGRPTRQRVRE